MKILVIADRGPQRSIRELLAENPVDLICLLGDLDKVEVSELASISHIPKLGVYGNHCSGTYFESLGIKNMHLDIFEYKGVIFGGFEGSVRYKESQYAKMYTQEESIEMLKGYPYVDVMLCHAPPFGVNDEPGDVAHEGLKGINEYLKREHPKHLMHGHTYPTEEALVTSYEDTNIIYVQGGKIITI